MTLLTKVKAGNITNLSNARYCAGMGVDIIGFPIKSGPDSRMEISKIKEITGWLAGIKTALEFHEEDLSVDENFIKEVLNELTPDYIQIPINRVEVFKRISEIPLLLTTNKIQYDYKLQNEDYLLFWGNIETNKDALNNFCLHYNNKVFLSCDEINETNVVKILSTINPFGIELKGQNEISPGLKSFDELSSILEVLEVEE
jgi:phosphoribosylanthranilate isomerase